MVYVDRSVCGNWICSHIQSFFRIPNSFRISELILISFVVTDLTFSWLATCFGKDGSG